ncbi:MAG: CHAT domain-containing protein, partial [Acetobacteraceae bacterium]|nr:CHAT domain-containing protein [Acetobacteraceae bacterium]
RAAFLIAGLLLAMGGCTTPPPDAYLSRQSGHVQGVAIGRDASNESCVQQARGGGATVDVFCGTWEQPSATVSRVGPGGADALTGLATSGPWRAGLDTRFVCAAPQPTTVLDSPAVIMTCTRKVGGWPQVALVASVGGQAYVADGIQPALPLIPRAIGVLSGQVAPERAAALPRSGAEALMASRMAAQAYSAGDIGQFETLIKLGTQANLAESYVAAEDAFRAALALQQKAIGKNNPDEADTLALIGVNVSDQGKYVEADALFSQAQRLAPRASDPVAIARVLHYRALHEHNQHHEQAALDLLRQAEARYAALLPPEALRRRPNMPGPFALGRSGTATVNNPVPNDDVVVDPAAQSALLGLLETRRYQAIVLRELGRPAESEAAIQSASALAISQGMRQPVLTARLLRTAAASAGARGEVADAASGFGMSSVAFGQALPGTRPLASTELLRAARLAQNGRKDAALAACRRAAALLRDLKAGAPPELIAPCLDIYAEAAQRAGGNGQPILAEMFEAAQQGQGSITSQQIARSAARLAENARNPRVGEAIRRRQVAGDRLAELTRERDAAALRAAGTDVPGVTEPLPPVGELDAQLAEARTQLTDADTALQAASPNYGQLVQEVVPASDVFAALRPGEAFASIALGEAGGWVFLLRDHTVTAAPVRASAARIRELVGRFRASIEPGPHGLPQFDSGAAQELYATTLGQVAGPLAGATRLVVAPTGPLLSVPFGALLTGPAGTDLAGAPWLVKQAAISHVPAAANFVSLRRVAGTSRAGRPWFGLGDFKPVTLAQAERTFPGPACVESARLFAGLPPLPFARRELEAARALLGGSSSDELIGTSYTGPAVQAARLNSYRILHFASHGLLPTD